MKLQDCSYDLLHENKTFDEVLYRALHITYRSLLSIYKCSLSDFVNIYNMIDYLQPNIKLNVKGKEITLPEILFEIYRDTSQLNHTEIINTNLSVEKRKQLLKKCIDNVSYSSNKFYIRERDGKFECDVLESAFKFYGVPLNKQEFKNYRRELSSFSGYDYQYGTWEEEEVADLYINDIFISHVCDNYDINNLIITYIVDYLIK